MKTRPNGFRAKLWRYFALFAVAVLALLWLLQTVLLQTFYEATVKAGVREASELIASAWTQETPDEFASTLDEVASSKSLLVFVAGWDRSVLYSTDEHSAAYADKSADAAASENSNANTDSYSWHNGAQGEDEQSGDASDENMPSWMIGQARHLGLTEGFDLFLEKLAQDTTTAVEYQDDDGSLYTYGIALPSAGQDGSACAVAKCEAVLYLSTTLQPIGAAVTAIRTQLVLATVVSLILAFALAFVLARGFSRPVEALNRKSRRIGVLAYDKTGNAAEQAKSSFIKGFCSELDELNDTLDEAAAELAHVEEQRAEFLANVSHDLRTPLTLIRGYAEAARDDALDGLEVDVSDLEIIAREAERMGELAGDLLDYAKMQDAGANPELASFDASAAFETAAQKFAPLCAKAGVSLSAQIAEGVTICGDASQLVRVATNFIDNAVSHTSPGGAVSVELRATQDHMRFEVSNDGPGIPANELDHIWERYFTKRQVGRNAKGSGLGLAISKEILEAHGAQYGARCDEGLTVFWFELPVASAFDASFS